MKKATQFMGEREKQRLLTKLEGHKRTIATERDALRDTIEEFNSIIETCDRAEEGLDTAIDALSELL